MKRQVLCIGILLAIAGVCLWRYVETELSQDIPAPKYQDFFAGSEMRRAQANSTKVSPDEERAAQQKVYEDSLRMQCRVTGGTPADCADLEAWQRRIEKQMQDKVDLFNRRATEQLERKTRPPGKQRFHSVTKART